MTRCLKNICLNLCALYTYTYRLWLISLTMGLFLTLEFMVEIAGVLSGSVICLIAPPLVYLTLVPEKAQARMIGIVARCVLILGVAFLLGGTVLLVHNKLSK